MDSYLSGVLQRPFECMWRGVGIGKYCSLAASEFKSVVLLSRFVLRQNGMLSTETSCWFIRKVSLYLFKSCLQFTELQKYFV